MLQENEMPPGAPRAAAPAPQAVAVPAGADGDKLALTPLARYRNPIGGQDIELQQLDYAHGGISLLRLRIREGKRFTIFEVDPVTARLWGEAMVRWAERQGR